MMTTITSNVAGALKTGLLALSLVAAGAGAASAHGFGGGGGGGFGGGHMGGGFSEHMDGGGFHGGGFNGGFHGGPVFHSGGYGGAPFLPHAFHVQNAYHGGFRHYGYGFPFFSPGYAFAPYDVYGDNGSDCYNRVVKLGTPGHYRYVREDSCG
ncbi:MAG TPA: hypothetical protein VIQ29_13300 [Ancylobacter sp.]